MAAKMKGIYKSFKCISQLFAVVKEREMEIGFPTDVKHVAHIGSDGSTTDSPSWMGEFKTGSDSLSPRQSFVTARQSSSFAHSISSSQDFDQAMRQQPIADVNMMATTNLPNIPKKQRRKKKSSSKISSPRRSSPSSRSAMSKSSYKSATSLMA